MMLTVSIMGTMARIRFQPRTFNLEAIPMQMNIPVKSNMWVVVTFVGAYFFFFSSTSNELCFSLARTSERALKHLSHASEMQKEVIKMKMRTASDKLNINRNVHGSSLFYFILFCQIGSVFGQ